MGIPDAVLADDIATGKVSSPEQIAYIRSCIVSDGPAAGCRAIDLAAMGGLSLRLLPDRGLDIGSAWYGGAPLAWISPVGETSPVPMLQDREWVDLFGGGLVTTCGLRNVGASSEGHPLHGRYSQQRAQNVCTSREVRDGSVSLIVRGEVVEASALGPVLHVNRTIKSSGGSARVEITDVMTNRGVEPEDAPLLYHVNLGYPLVDDSASIHIDGSSVLPRDEDSASRVEEWRSPGRPIPGAEELVVEHVVTPNPDTGWAEAKLRNERLGLELIVSWEVAGLPRFHQWLHRRAGVYVVAFEPANCSVLGRAHDREDGRPPRLGPGEVRTTQIRIEVTPIGSNTSRSGC